MVVPVSFICVSLAKFVKLVTLAISSPDRSAFKDEQLLNIANIDVTLLVSQPLTSNVVNG